MPRDGRADDKMHRMDFYPGDYLSDAKVIAMDWEAQGAYTKFLFVSWMSGPLPADLGMLARVLGGTEKQLRKLWPQIAPCLTEGPTPGTLVQPRLERERLYALGVRERKQNGARVTNERRWKSQSDGKKASLSDRLATPASDRPHPQPHPHPHTHPPSPPPAAGGCAPPDGVAGVCVEKSSSPKQSAADRPPDDGVDGAAVGTDQAPDDEREAALWAAWQAGRSSRKLPSDRFGGHHETVFAELLDAAGEDVPLAVASIAAYFGWNDPFLRDAGWSIRVFPHRFSACVAKARDDLDRAARRVRDPLPATTADEADVTPPDEAKRRLADLRALVAKSAEAAP